MGLISVSNSKFKTSRGPTSVHKEKVSTERMSSSFYVDDEDEELDEEEYGQEGGPQNIETFEQLRVDYDDEN
jgi:hypothetical protein